MQFALIIIGDEILHGTRQDKHFTFFKQLMESKGLQLASIQYLPDDRAILVRQLARSFSDGIPTFVTGGIGSTPDDHTRQAAAEALHLPLERHAEAIQFIEERTLSMGETFDSIAHHHRAQMADFPAGASIIPNPFNKIAGFSINQHYFFPGFPQMAHPMAQWVLETYYAKHFHQTEYAQHSAIVEGLPESAITSLMQTIETRWLGIKTFSLPTVSTQEESKIRFRLEFGIKAQGNACAHLAEAWIYAKNQLQQLGASKIDEVIANK